VLIDPYHTGWLSHLDEREASLPSGASLILLLDGAFVPGLFRQLDDEIKPTLLFESLPSCSEETKDVSPFLVRFETSNQSLRRVLSRCSGKPMVSAIATHESVEQLGARLAAWCIVEADGQRFNFRFPDTRRLPAIFEALTQQQRLVLAGSAFSWTFVGRDGHWQHLPIEAAPDTVEPTEQATLNEHQFGKLVADSEADEVWVQLLDRGIESDLLPSQRHVLIAEALRIADKSGLDMLMKLSWCASCIDSSGDGNDEQLLDRFALWLKEQTRNDDEAIHHTV